MQYLKIIVFACMLMVLGMLSGGCGPYLTLSRLQEEAQKAYEAADYPTALEKWQAGLNQARVLNDKRYISQFLSNIGIVYANLGQYEKALRYFEQALAINRKIGDRQGESAALTNIGLVYADLGQGEQALEYFEQALTIDREFGDRQGESIVLNNIGMVYRDLGQYARALEYHKQALAIDREFGYRRGEGAGLSNIGVVSWKFGQYEQALEYYQQALAIHKGNGDRLGEAETLGDIGGVYDELGQYEQALRYFEQALAIHKDIGYRLGEGNALGSIGVVYDELGQYDQALEHHQQALTIHKDIGYRLGEGIALGSIGNVYRNLGQHEQALEHFEQALTTHKDIGDHWGEGIGLTNIGEMYSELGQYSKAYPAFQNGIAIFESLGTPDGLWTAQSGLAAVEIQLKQLEAAITHYEKALDNIERLRAGLREKEHKLSFMQSRLYVYDEFIEFLQDLHKDHPDKGYDRKALEIFERKQGRVFLEEMGKSGARLFAGLPETITQKERDLELQLEQTRKQLVDERSKLITEQNKELIQNLEEQEKTLLIEQEALQEQIKIDYPDYYALKYPKPVSLTELQKNILEPDELMLVYNVMEEKMILWLISSDMMKMYTLSVGENVLQEEIAELRRIMEIEWKQSRGRRVDLCLDAPKKKTFAEVSYELYTLLIPEEVRPLLTEEHPVNIVPTGPLYALPFEALVTREPTLAPSQADRGLTGKPTPNPSQEGNVHYLTEDIPISYLSSASLLKTLRESQARRQATAPYPLLAFAHPVYESPSPNPSHQGRGTDLPSPNPSQEGNNTPPAPQGGNVSLQALRSQAYHDFLRGYFKELPETAEEAKAIKTLLNAPDNSEPLQLREKASCENVFAFNSDKRLDDYQYLVFATHGVLPGEVDQITQPALVLSYPEDNGYLTMADVFQLQLNAKLVSLSACNTGSGEQVRGEGVMGLTRAFMYAGTPAIAVTLWSVETFSAKELDVGLFEHLKAGQPPADALRTIKLQMLRGEKGEDYKHPYYWAPFVVFGDAK